MKIVNLPRRGGKTKMIAEYMIADKGSIVIVHHQSCARTLGGYGVEENRIFSPERFLRNCRNGRNGLNVVCERILIDDFDLVIPIIFSGLLRSGVEIPIATYSGEE